MQGPGFKPRPPQKKKIIFLRFETLTLEFLAYRKKKKKILEKLLQIDFHFEAKNNFIFLVKWIF